MCRALRVLPLTESETNEILFIGAAAPDEIGGQPPRSIASTTQALETLVGSFFVGEKHLWEQALKGRSIAKKYVPHILPTGTLPKKVQITAADPQASSQGTNSPVKVSFSRDTGACMLFRSDPLVWSLISLLVR